MSKKIIPDCVFAKYKKYADAMIEELGIICQLVYPSEPKPVTVSVPHIKQRMSMDIRGENDFARGDQSLITEEVKEDIKLRVYWSKKQYQKMADVNVPDGTIMCIGHLRDMNKLERASFLIIYDSQKNKDFRFEKAAESQVHGLDKNYLMSFWKRA